MGDIRITPKEAKATFIKFLMSNNCYREYVECYKNNYQSTEKKHFTPSQIFDYVITQIINGHGRRLRVALIYCSFSWSYSSIVLCRMHNKAKFDSYSYWAKLNYKFEDRYKDYLII